MKLIKKLTYYDAFLVFLFMLNVLPFLAPLLADMGFNLPAKVIYSAYSFMCHQFSWRSIHILDHQVAWCARDTFIWGTMFAIALVVRLYKVKKMQWYWVIPFVIPIALDGGIQTIATILGYASGEPYYMSTNTIRMLTGGLFGIGLGLWMMPTLKELFLEE